MLSTSYFSLPLHASHQPLSLRAARYKPSRKRKRDDDHEQEKEEGDSGSSTTTTTDDGPSSSGRAAIATAEGVEGKHAPISGFTPVTRRSLAALATPVDAQQYQAAGQPFEEPLPDQPFPHRPTYPLDGLYRGRGTVAPRTCQEELANLSPPLYLPNPSYSKISSAPAAPAATQQQHSKLRQHHLSVLTTILHRCLLDGDFLRAGRAWGMILRADSGGRGVHLTKEGRWGVGAEILLRRDTEISMLLEEKEGTVEQEDEEDSNWKPKHLGAWFTRQGFEKAKEYYERLSLQYQFRKWNPHSVSSLDFYPAMFSTWIYITQAEYKAGQSGDRGWAEASPLRDDHLSGSELTPSSPNGQDRLLLLLLPPTNEKECLRKKTLKEAEDIAARMDELMVSPPYSDSLQLWNLRGMVSLWISDICMAPLPIADEMIGSGGTSKGANKGTNIIEGESIPRRDHERNLQRRKDEIRTAKAAFEKAGRGDSVIPFEDDVSEDVMDDSQG
ncbi:MAG: hypothetical protein M1813_002509 [Trichoglossum hirsutum]|nr:MAG: hypothetical protein M1813_002509 [Trichoglossum hirsutum]